MKREFKKLTFRLEVDLVDDLRELSKKTGISQTFLVTKALRKILEDAQKEDQKEEQKNEK